MNFVDMPVQVQVIAADVLGEKLRYVAKGESSLELARDVKVAFEGLYAEPATPAAVNQRVTGSESEEANLATAGIDAQRDVTLIILIAKHMLQVSKSSTSISVPLQFKDLPNFAQEIALHTLSGMLQSGYGSEKEPMSTLALQIKDAFIEIFRSGNAPASQ